MSVTIVIRDKKFNIIPLDNLPKDCIQASHLGYTYLRDEYNHLQFQLAQAKADLEKAEKVIEFYGKPTESYQRGLTTYTRYKNDDESHVSIGYTLKLRGKRARKYFQDKKELEGKHES